MTNKQRTDVQAADRDRLPPAVPPRHAEAWTEPAEPDEDGEEEAGYGYGV